MKAGKKVSCENARTPWNGLLSPLQFQARKKPRPRFLRQHRRNLYGPGLCGWRYDWILLERSSMTGVVPRGQKPRLGLPLIDPTDTALHQYVLQSYPKIYLLLVSSSCSLTWGRGLSPPNCASDAFDSFARVSGVARLYLSNEVVNAIMTHTRSRKVENSHLSPR